MRARMLARLCLGSSYELGGTGDIGEFSGSSGEPGVGTKCNGDGYDRSGWVWGRPAGGTAAQKKWPVLLDPTSKLLSLISLARPRTMGVLSL